MKFWMDGFLEGWMSLTCVPGLNGFGTVQLINAISGSKFALRAPALHTKSPKKENLWETRRPALGVRV